MSSQREPIFNAPTVVVLLLAVLVAIQVVRGFLGEQADVDLLLRFAFIPARYDAASEYAAELASVGAGPKVWTFVTYALLHGGWLHLVVNSVWMLAFGSALAWRFGAFRFLIFSALTAVAGAATHLALHFGQPIPVVGASAAISAHMAGAMRFIFQAGGPVGALRARGRPAFMAPAEPIGVAIRRPAIATFLLVWFAANILFGVFGGMLTGEDANVAWEAHIGGFLAGIVLFPLFDPVRRDHDPVDPEDGWEEVLRQDAAGPHDGLAGAAGRKPLDS